MSYAARLSDHYSGIRARLRGVNPPPKVLLPAPSPEAPAKERDYIYLDFNPLVHVPMSKAETIIRQVLKKHTLNRRELVGRQRSANIVLARQEAAWRMKKETTLSLPQIGTKLGGRDHTTILYSVRAHEARLNGEVYRKNHQRYYEAKATAEAGAP